MDAEKAFTIQKQVKQNVKTLQSYMTDLQNWESEMKRKEAALTGQCEQDLPPIRSKIKKEKPVAVSKKPEKRIASSDYSSWEKFDVDKACEEVDMEGIGPSSLDSKKSKQSKLDKLREEAQYEKERGNNFVKQEKWNEAISCYNRAIELVQDDAIYYANRGLCHLKNESLHLAEKDCTMALALDPTYVKALQRRALARERLGSLRAASRDLARVLQLEPRNQAASRALHALTHRMGTKGTKLKSSPVSTPLVESKPLLTSNQAKIVELEDQPTTVEEKRAKNPEKSSSTPESQWQRGAGENVTIITPVKKPPHLRSKRALKPITIQEIQLGKTTPEKPPTRLKIIDIDNLAQGDNNNTDSNKIDGGNPNIVTEKGNEKSSLINGSLSPESEKLGSEFIKENERVDISSLVPPTNSVQFMSEWKFLKGKGDARSDYLSLIDPLKIPAIFDNALESDVLSELLYILKENKQKFKEKTVTAYLKGLVRVKRFGALAMFLSKTDKESIHKLLVHCRTAEGCSENDIADLKNKFEL